MGLEQQAVHREGEGLAHDLRGGEGTQGGAGDELVRQGEQGGGAAAAEVSAVQKRGDGWRGFFATLIERAIMIRDSGLAPTGLGVMD